MVRRPSSVAARKTRMAISLRLATSNFLKAQRMELFPSGPAGLAASLFSTPISCVFIRLKPIHGNKLGEETVARDSLNFPLSTLHCASRFNYALVARNIWVHVAGSGGPGSRIHFCQRQAALSRHLERRGRGQKGSPRLSRTQTPPRAQSGNHRHAGQTATRTGGRGVVAWLVDEKTQDHAGDLSGYAGHHPQGRRRRGFARRHGRREIEYRHRHNPGPVFARRVGRLSKCVLHHEGSFVGKSEENSRARPPPAIRRLTAGTTPHFSSGTAARVLYRYGSLRFS